MTGRYAQGTEVSPGRSREEIERTLARYGAEQFAYGYDSTRAMVGFTVNGRQIRFVLPMPDRNDAAFTRTPTGKDRAPDAAYKAWEGSVRQSWRALAIVIKAKLEAVESGIVTFDDEFAMHMVLPDGQTVAAHVGPAIEHAYATGTVAPLIALTPGGRP